MLKKNTTRQILIWKFHNASDFGLEKIRRVGFWNKIFSKCQIFKKCLHPKNHVLVHYTPWKRHNLHFSSLFRKHDLELKTSSGVRFWFKKKYNASDFELKKYNASDFKLKKLQRIWFWNENLSFCQISNIKFRTCQILN